MVSSTYEQIDNSGRISLVNGKQRSEPMYFGVEWGCRSTLRCAESLSLLYQWSRRVLECRKTNMKEGDRGKRIENGIK